MNTYYSSCPLNFEDILEQELLSIGAVDIKREHAGAYYKGEEDLLYRASLNLRVTSVVRLLVARFPFQDKNELYKEALKVKWQEHFTAGETFRCKVTHTGRICAPENYLALVLKDAIADSFRREGGKRPSVAPGASSDMAVHLFTDGAYGNILLDLGRALHKRGLRRAYKEEEGGAKLLKAHAAPIKENLAAALLYRAGWPAAAANGRAFADPMCGSGTFLTEAYMMAAHKAPNLEREILGFERWKRFDPDLLERERERARETYAAHKSLCPPIFGYDRSSTSLIQAQAAILGADAGHIVTLKQAEVATLEAPAEDGFLLSNAPYGERLGTRESADELFAKLGANFKKNFKGWDVSLLLPDESAIRRVDLRAGRVNAFYNGPDERVLARFTIEDSDRPKPPMSEETGALAEFLAERARALKDPLTDVIRSDAYRIYDGEIPCYPAIVDAYGGYYLVQVYEQEEWPAEMEQKRLKEISRALNETFGASKSDVFWKKRTRRHATKQYEKSDEETVERVITENDLKFYVNLSNYIDSGIYLDHRPLRRLFKEISKQKSFLNLFCYTGTASVAAAAGGASLVCSVDSSASYLDTASRNVELNALPASVFTYYKTDCRFFLNRTDAKFDIIYVDPPTFSAGTDRDDFDIDKHHASLLDLCANRLNEDGEIYFSTHYGKLKLDQTIIDRYDVVDITDKSFDEDFYKRAAHKVWLIKKRAT